MAKTATTKKSMLSSAKTQTKTAKTTPKIRFGGYSPEAILEPTGKTVTAKTNNERVIAVKGKTVSEALTSGLYTLSALRYDIERVKTLKIA